jgi:hypothetical protein
MKKMSLIIGGTLAVFFLLILSIVSFSLLREGVESLSQAIDAKKWTTTKSTLQDVHLVSTRTSRGGQVYEVKVRYSYEVKGVSYEGNNLSFGYSPTNGGEHSEIYRKLKSAKQVEVRFNPAKHSESSLTFGVYKSHYITIILGAIAALIALSGMAIIILLSLQTDVGLLSRLVILE